MCKYINVNIILHNHLRKQLGQKEDSGNNP